MKKAGLNSKKLKVLRALALSMGIKRPSASRKVDLITEILAAEKIKKFKKFRTKKTSFARSVSDNKVGSPRRIMVQKRGTTSKTAVEVRSVENRPSLAHKFESPPAFLLSQNPSPYDHLGELPDSYGTGRLFFTARDPHWIYASWDYAWHQMEEMRRSARNGELRLRIHAGANAQAPVIQDIILNPASRNWLIKVDQSNALYYAEFGYEDFSGKFITTSRAPSTRTPPDRMSDNTTTNFVTIPFHISFRKLFEMVKAHIKDGEELADVLYRLQRAGFRFPFEYFLEQDWSPDQGAGLNRLFGSDVLQLLRTGSLEVTNWLRPTSSGSH